MFAEQLLTNANSEYRLAQFLNYAVESTTLKVRNGSCRFALSRENDAVGTLNFFGITRNNRLYSDAAQGIDYRANIAGIILNYSSFHENWVVEMF